jgi:hypothetical protein
MAGLHSPSVLPEMVKGESEYHVEEVWSKRLVPHLLDTVPHGFLRTKPACGFLSTKPTSGFVRTKPHVLPDQMERKHTT